MLKLDLPWPNRALHPNARTHWAVKARHTKAHRRTGYLLALAASRAAPASSWPDRIDVRLVFHPPTTRHRDGDGLLSNCKAYLDGIADALGINDTRFRILPVELAELAKPGKVLVEIGS